MSFNFSILALESALKRVYTALFSKASLLVPALVTFLFLFLTALGNDLDLIWLDKMFHLRGPIAAPSDVVVVGVDREAYAWNNPTPYCYWPRGNWALALEKLAAYHPAVVAIDINFADAGALEADDENLARAISALPVVLIKDKAYREEQRPEGKVIIENVQEPFGPFKHAASAFGRVLVRPDKGGVVRHFPEGRARGAGESIFEAAVRIGRPNRAKALEADQPGRHDYINYYGPGGVGINHLPALSLLNGSAKEAQINGKIVFLGGTTLDKICGLDSDVKRTVFPEQPMFGVEVLATSAANLLDGSWLRRLSLQSEALLAALTVLFCALAVWRIGSLHLEWAPALIPAIGYFPLSYYAFRHGYFIPGVPATLCLALAYLLKMPYRLISAISVLQRLRKSLANFVNEKQVEDIVTGLQEVGSKAQKATLTISMSDMAKYSTIAEQQDSTETFDFITDYLGRLVATLDQQGGKIMGIPGDAVFAAWRNEEGQAPGPDRAVETALQMLRGSQEISLKYNIQVRTRIGIHQGDATVGRLGTHAQFTTSAIGDAVNIAARLETLNSILGTSILISESAKALLTKDYQTILIGSFILSGRSEPTKVYCVMEEQIQSSFKERWSEMRAQFARKNWDAAAALLSACKPLDQRFAHAIELHQRVIKLYREAPPTSLANWQGEIAVAKVEDCVLPTGSRA